VVPSTATGPTQRLRAFVGQGSSTLASPSLSVSSPGTVVVVVLDVEELDEVELLDVVVLEVVVLEVVVVVTSSRGLQRQS
jgi:hypothetical protein